MKFQSARVLLVGAGLAAAAAGAAARAQDPLRSSQTFRTKTEIVEIDVSVLDKHRRPVRGLTTADFTLLEDGQARPISVFSAIDVPDPVEPPAAWMRDVAPDVVTNAVDDRRLVVLVFDDATVAGDLATLQAARAAAHAAVDQLGPGDLAAVVFALDNRGAQDFTMDRARLHRAIDRSSYGFGSNDEPLFSDLEGNAIGSCDCGLCSIRVLTNASRYLAEIPHRRKVLIYVSAGVRVDFTPSATNRCAWRQKAEFDRALDAARVANVNFYPVDPSGLKVLPGGRPPWPDLAMEFLQIAARNTGGRAIINNNYPSTEIGRIFRENTSYYLIGYEPSPELESGAVSRRLDVKVDRPDVEVRARTRYTRAVVGSSARPVPALEQAAGGVLPVRDLRARATAAPFALPGVGGQATVIVAVGLEAPADALAAAPVDRAVENVQLLVRAFDPDGRPRVSIRRNARVTFRTGEGLDSRYEVTAALPLPPGRYQLRVAARSVDQDKVGAVHLDVDVPQFDRDPLAMSGLAVALSPAPPSSPVPESITSLLPVAPTAVRDFRTSDRVTIFGRIHQGGDRPLAPVSVAVRVFDGQDRRRADTAVHLDASSFDADRAANLSFELPLAGLEPGDYLLSVEAVLDARHRVRRDVRFAVKER